jgi:mono/diheme cytochrome c family protein
MSPEELPSHRPWPDGLRQPGAVVFCKALLSTVSWTVHHLRSFHSEERPISVAGESDMNRTRSMVCYLALVAAAPIVAATEDEDRFGDHDWEAVRAHVIAVGIPGAGAVAEVGDFLRGSPLHDKTDFVAFTQSGQVLDPKRVLVASTSNFGAPLARPGEPEGSVLSIDPNHSELVVPHGFASGGSQAAALGGAVRVYSAQNPSFLNSVQEPTAVTAGLPAVSLPLGISINNGNGRPWIANGPYGAAGVGTITVLDPQGYPLAGAPDPIAGGVFAGNQTNRSPASTHGLTSAALGTAIMTKSPDLTGRAVFAVVNADGSVVQVNVLKGVDGLAPPGTVTPLTTVDRASAESIRPNTVARAGIAFNWVPQQSLFIADPQANRLVVLDLTDDGTVFKSRRREIRSEFFRVPLDIAPTTREVSSGSFASNTTLGGGSDLYVLNRGNNTILRLSLEGRVLAARLVAAPLPGFRLNGIAVSSDGQTVYLTATTTGGGGALLSIPAFGENSTTSELRQAARRAGQSADLTQFGTFLFSAGFSPHKGLGPLFNESSCVGCHSAPFAGGMGLDSSQTEQLVGRFKGNGSFDDLAGRGGPVARTHSVAELGVDCDLPPGVPVQATVTSTRNSMTLRGNGLLDTIALGDMLANMALEPAEVRGRPNLLPDGRVGKFGWKANVATLVEFMGDAFRNEIGLTNPLQPSDEIRACNANRHSPEVDALALQATAKFLNTLDPPAPPASCTTSTGATVFQTVGCANCHTPTLPGPGARQAVPLYSDLLLHHMGPALADDVQQGAAEGDEWRTMPLWRVSERGRFLHDGRATTLVDAIFAHDGQGRAARQTFTSLDPASKQALIAFLGCL